MSEYGVTPQGVVIKRLDTIIDELHSDLSEGWGKNTRLNPKSRLNVQLTSYADKWAELWEFGEQIYYSMYPFSAEGISLDNSTQFGGVPREEAKPTYYPIHCECIDGTRIPKGSMIKSSTNPALQFLAVVNTAITRSCFNRANIRVVIVQPYTLYTVAINGILYSYTSGENDDEAEILAGLAEVIIDTKYYAVADDGILSISATDIKSTSQLVLSGNLTTESITGIVNYASKVNGEVVLPYGSITQIVTSVNGLLGVCNNLPHIAGSLRQTDVEHRQAYADKIFARSSRMLESIKSAILLNVQGVTGVVAYQNDTNEVDDYGRWPHCVEVVVEGGGDYEIALQIWEKKTCGIQTYGDTEVVVHGNEGEPVTMRFNRPEYVYIWYRLSITLNPSETLPPNYVEAIQGLIMEANAEAEQGKSIIPQRLIDSRIYGKVPGIAYIETESFYTIDQNEQPGTYTTGVVPIKPRQRAITDAARIGVVLSG